MELQFGAFCPTLSAQLDKRVSVSVGQMIDRHASAIDRLRIHGLLSESEVHKARTRLIRKIEKEVKMASKKTIKP